MKTFLNLFALILISILLNSCVTIVVEKKEEPIYVKPKPKLNELIKEFSYAVKKNEINFDLKYYGRIDTLIADTINKDLKINFSKEFSYNFFRDESVKKIYSVVKDFFGKEFEDYSIKIYCMNEPIEELIPNFFRKDTSVYDLKRLAKESQINHRQVVTNTSKNFTPAKGLFNRNIVLWHSHGWYFNNKESRWEWQRPRLFQSVEDKIPMSFTIPYLIPMLENAGANVYVPRERDFQTNEVVVDNDSKDDIKSKSYLEFSKDKKNSWLINNQNGFALGILPYKINYNPFAQGTSKFIKSEKSSTAKVEWAPNITESGEYAVYISYTSSSNNVTDAKYSVLHSGGKTEFKINQTIGGNTWIYLGTFHFKAGKKFENGKVILENISDEAGKIVSADAVRFGGGMGLIERDETTSNRPKFLEGAKYWLQYAGMPDTLIYNLNNNNDDYRDDYQCRAEYGNYLYGSPFGPNKNRNAKGLGIPIDLSLAFHTDAGISNSDTSIGTLSIYSIEGFDSSSIFPNGVSRFANRDLADIVQTQITNDISNKYDNVWNRRQLRNANYSESVRPNVPSMLLELLSHQNFLDMKFVQDPNFRFDVSRAIYKGFVKFLSAQHKTDYVIQPLPVTHFASDLDNDGNVTLSWKPQVDKLEPTAIPKKYKVYTRVDENGFDNGQITDIEKFTIKNIKAEKIYSFKVTAINDGGESFPSEILSVCWMNNKKRTLLVINGFTRISAPALINASSFSGFTNFLDEGVENKSSCIFTGEQYNFEPNSVFITNDAPGFGASKSDFETKIIMGNTFDFPFIHGQAIKNCGYSFVSTSKDAVMDEMVNLNNYKFIDLILGEEKETKWQKPFGDSINGTKFKIFPSKLRNQIEKFLKNKGNIFISGAYTGTDLFNKNKIDSSEIYFAKKILRYQWSSSFASSDGKVLPAKNSVFHKIDNLIFNTNYRKDIYRVEAPDAIESINGSKTILKYAENDFSAATGFKDEYGVIVFGFPFETIISSKTRNEVMHEILQYLKVE